MLQSMGSQRVRYNWVTEQQQVIYSVVNITLPTKVHLLKAMVLPVVMYGCESWTVKKLGH